jgi:hypothetical protein
MIEPQMNLYRVSQTWKGKTYVFVVNAPSAELAIHVAGDAAIEDDNPAVNQGWDHESMTWNDGTATAVKIDSPAKGEKVLSFDGYDNAIEAVRSLHNGVVEALNSITNAVETINEAYGELATLYNNAEKQFVTPKQAQRGVLARFQTLARAYRAVCLEAESKELDRDEVVPSFEADRDTVIAIAKHAYVSMINAPTFYQSTHEI